MGEEILASYLYQVQFYQWLKENGFGAALTDSDLGWAHRFEVQRGQLSANAISADHNLPSR
jgi:hypothetical protein